MCKNDLIDEDLFKFYVYDDFGCNFQFVSSDDWKKNLV